MLVLLAIVGDRFKVVWQPGVLLTKSVTDTAT